MIYLALRGSKLSSYTTYGRSPTDKIKEMKQAQDIVLGVQGLYP